MPSTKPNTFAAAVKRKETVQASAAPTVDSEEEAPATVAVPTVQKAPQKPSRTNVKHIGGYFDPAVGKQMRVLAAEEETTVQALLEEALDMLFHARRKPTIAQRAKG